jgi:hypothetical protein
MINYPTLFVPCVHSGTSVINHLDLISYILFPNTFACHTPEC